MTIIEFGAYNTTKAVLIKRNKAYLKQCLTLINNNNKNQVPLTITIKNLFSILLTNSN